MPSVVILLSPDGASRAVIAIHGRKDRNSCRLHCVELVVGDRADDGRYTSASCSITSISDVVCILVVMATLYLSGYLTGRYGP